MLQRGLCATALFFVLMLTTAAATADDWVAQKLRGGVFTFVGDAWVQVHRGDVIPDRQLVRTQNNGRVSLVRGAEIVTLGPSSQVEIVDKDGQQFTTVKQSYGTVEIEAEVRNVQHFAVVNLHLAAVVKGTRFTVKTTDKSASVDVARGQVSVKDSLTRQTVEVPAGHSVTTGADATLIMDGGPTADAPISPSFVASTSGETGTTTPNGSDAVSVSTSSSGGGGNSNTSGDAAGNSGDNNGNGHGNGNSNDNNGSGPGNNGNGNAYGHDNGNNGNGGGNGTANGHNK